MNNSDGSYVEEENSSVLNELISNSSDIVYCEQRQGNLIGDSVKKPAGNL